MRRFLPFALAVFLSACADTATIRAEFVCEDGTTLAVTFDNAANTATVRGAKGNFVLPIGMSGSGYNYQTPDRQLRGKGRDVAWTDAGLAPVNCRQR